MSILQNLKPLSLFFLQTRLFLFQSQNQKNPQLTNNSDKKKQSVKPPIIILQTAEW